MAVLLFTFYLGKLKERGPGRFLLYLKVLLTVPCVAYVYLSLASNEILQFSMAESFFFLISGGVVVSSIFGLYLLKQFEQKPDHYFQAAKDDIAVLDRYLRKLNERQASELQLALSNAIHIAGAGGDPSFASPSSVFWDTLISDVILLFRKPEGTAKLSPGERHMLAHYGLNMRRGRLWDIFSHLFEGWRAFQIRFIAASGVGLVILVILDRRLH